MITAASNTRPEPDRLLTDLAEYAVHARIDGELARDTAYQSLVDAVGCGLLALRYSDCTRHLGPIVPGTTVPGGVPVPGTGDVLDPVKAAYDIGTAVRWLDYNDTWLAAEWGHPSDNLGEGVPLLWAKFASNVRDRYPDPAQADRILAAVGDRTAVEGLSVGEFLALFPAPDGRSAD